MRHDTARGDPDRDRRPAAGTAGPPAPRAARRRRRRGGRRVALHRRPRGHHGLRASVPPRRRLRRPAADGGRALDPRHAPARRHAGLRRRAPGHGRLGGGRGPRVPPRRTPWPVRHRPEAATTPSRSTPTGLAPGRWYFYRFRLDGVTSPVGRTRTAPADLGRPRAACASGVVSCSQLTGRLLRRLPPPRRPRRPRRRAPPRRLPLRGRRRGGRRPAARAGPRDRQPVRLPPPARAVQGGPRPAAAARGATRSSSPGTTTRSPTTAGARARRTTSPTRATTWSARRAPSACTTSGCRCA